MPETVNAQIIDVINTAQAATMDFQIVKTSGAGKAYQSVAQSAAIAVQDAADALRNVSTIATATAGVAMAQFLATKEDSYLKALQETQQMMTAATNDFAAIGKAATGILNDFPNG